MKKINANNSEHVAIEFFENGGYGIMVFACLDGEYWFTVGEDYKTLEGAKRQAVKKMAKRGCTFDENEMAALKF
jgi:hypothetical protein